MRTIADLLRDYLAAGDRGDDEALVQLLAPEVVVHAPGGVVTTGVDAALAAWSGARSGLDQLEHRVLDVLESEGDRAAARISVSGVHTGTFLGASASGTHLQVDQAIFIRGRDGRIAELWEVVDTGSGLQQLGLVRHDQPLAPGT